MSAIAAPLAIRSRILPSCKRAPSGSDHNTNQDLPLDFNHWIALRLGGAWRRDRQKHQRVPQEISVIALANWAGSLGQDSLVSMPSLRYLGLLTNQGGSR